MLCSKQAVKHHLTRHSAALPVSGRRPRSSSCCLVRAQAAPNDAVKVFYRTSWGSAKLHGSLFGAKWRDFELKKVQDLPSQLTHPDTASMHCQSRLRALTIIAVVRPVQVTSAPGKWMSTTIHLQNSNGVTSPILEFVVTDGGNQWDKPTEGERPTALRPLSASAEARSLSVCLQLNCTVVANQQGCEQLVQ